MMETAAQLLRFAGDLPMLAPLSRSSPARLLSRNAARRPAELAITFGSRRYTWAGVDREASRCARWFSDAGLGEGDVVALLMDNRPEFLFAVMGLNRIGAVGALINTGLTGSPLAHALITCRPAMILAGGEHEESAAEAIRSSTELASDLLHVQPKSGGLPAVPAAARTRGRRRFPGVRGTFCLIYTSGTTGLPKAAIIRNQRALGAGFCFGRLMHRCGPGDVIYVPLPLHHTSALLLGWGSALATGAAVALRERFSATAFWGDVREVQATSFVYIGELCRYLLNQPPHPQDGVHRLRVAVGNGLSPTIWTAFKERFRIPTIREFYGSTEGNAFALNLRGRTGMIGRLGIGQRVVRCDPETGQILRDARGRAVSAASGETGLLVGRISPLSRYDGYLDRAATEKKIVRNVRTSGDRYFDTGDLVRLHEGRWLSFVDRLGDTFRWKGENVSTTEVAAILDAAPGVSLSTVYGVEVPGNDGRAGMATLVTRTDFDPERFGAHVRAQLAPAHRPQFLRLVAGAMRVTDTLKPQKNQYQREGFDPARVAESGDRLLALIDGHYVPLDETTLGRLGAEQRRIG